MAKSIVGKLPYMQLYPTDIIADTRLLSLEARGAWYDFLMFAWHAPERGTITMPLSGWGRMWGISAERAGEIIAEIGQLGVGDVNIKNDECNAGNDSVTLTNRRMKRECNAREKTRKRVEKHRVTKPEANVKRECNADGNADVTPTRARFQRPETRNTPLTPQPGGRGSGKISELEKPEPPDAETSVARCEARLTQEYQAALQIWLDERKKRKLHARADAAARDGAELLATEIKRGTVTAEEVRLAIAVVLDDPERRTKWGLCGIAKNLGNLIDAANAKKPKQAAPKIFTPEPQLTPSEIREQIAQFERDIAVAKNDENEHGVTVLRAGMTQKKRLLAKIAAK